MIKNLTINLYLDILNAFANWFLIVMKFNYLQIQSAFERTFSSSEFLLDSVETRSAAYRIRKPNRNYRLKKWYLFQLFTLFTLPSAFAVVIPDRTVPTGFVSWTPCERFTFYLIVTSVHLSTTRRSHQLRSQRWNIFRGCDEQRGGRGLRRW